MRDTAHSRRRFLRSAAVLSAAAGLPIVVPASVLGADGRPAPSNRITVGAIGMGGQGTGNLDGFLGDKRCQVLAVNGLNLVIGSHARAQDNGRESCFGQPAQPPPELRFLFPLAQFRGGLQFNLPQHARERLAEMRDDKLFTSDLSVNEFVLVREAGFEPVGLVYLWPVTG